MRAPKVVDFYTAAWPDFTPALTGLSRSGSDLELVIGRYHSWDELRGRQYGRRVLELAHQLRELWGTR